MCRTARVGARGLFRSVVAQRGVPVLLGNTVSPARGLLLPRRAFRGCSLEPASRFLHPCCACGAPGAGCSCSALPPEEAVV